MAVRVRLYSRLRDAIGRDEIVLDHTPKNVGELIESITRMYGDRFRSAVYQEGRLRDNLMILVNGHSIKLLKGLETPLSENDNVSIDVIDVIEIIGGG